MAGEPRKRADQKRSSASRTVDLELRLARALNHPLRAEVLAMINREPLAAAEISERLGLPLSKVSYHVRVLHQLECIEPIREELVRGALKTTYRGRTRMLLDDIAWATLSEEARSGLAMFSVGLMVDGAGEAIAAETSEGDPDQHLGATTLALDAEGWSEVTEVLARTLDRVISIEAEAAERVNGVDRRFQATVGIAGFETPKRRTPPKP